MSLTLKSNPDVTFFGHYASAAWKLYNTVKPLDHGSIFRQQIRVGMAVFQ